VNINSALESPAFATSEDMRRRWWPMRPNTGIFWADMLWLLVIGAIDSHILPTLTGGILPFMIMTPWLVVTFVVASPQLSFAALIVGSLIHETNSGAPRGMYLTVYWIIFAILTLTRKSLSWRHAVPWLVTFFISSFFISNFESLLIFLRQDASQLDFFHFSKQVVSVTLCMVVGMGLAHPWMMRFKGETPPP
jgi:hypothetical protein